jgi:hypothetical protein
MTATSEPAHGITARWLRLSLRARTAVVLYQVAVATACGWLLKSFNDTQPLRSNWQDAITAVVIVFVLLELLMAVVTAVIASRRHRKMLGTRAAVIPVVIKGWRTRWADAWRGFAVMCLWVFGVYLLIMVGGPFTEWLLPESQWATRWRYSLQDGLSDAQYKFGSIPHDCEFLTAPMGAKHCYYEKQVLTTRIRRGESGLLEVSRDEGNSWSPADATDRATVLVWWKKIQE